jgi:hypothetical protein
MQGLSLVSCLWLSFLAAVLRAIARYAESSVDNILQ